MTSRSLPIRSSLVTAGAPQLVTSISAAADGSVWAADGSTTLYRVVSGDEGSNNGWAQQPGLAVNSLSAAADGSVWAIAGGNQVMTFVDGGWQSHSSPVPPSGWIDIAAGSQDDLWCWLQGTTSIWHFDRTSQQWPPIPVPALTDVRLVGLSVAADGTVWSTGSGSGEPFAGFYDRETAQWHLAATPPESLQSVSVGAEEWVWAVGRTSGQVYQYDASTASWLPVTGPAPQTTWVSVGDDLTVWAGTSNSVYALDLSTQTWSSVPLPVVRGIHPAISPTIGDAAHIWMYTTVGIFRYVANTQTWQSVQQQGNPIASLTQIACGSASTIWGLEGSGNVYTVTAEPSGACQLSQVGGQLARMSVAADGSVWGIDGTGQLCQLVEGSFQGLGQPSTGALRALSAASDATVWCVDASGNVYQYAAADWQPIAAVPGGCGDISAAADGSVWALDNANHLSLYLGDVAGGTEPWFQTGAILKQVAAGDMGNVWGIDPTGAPLEVTGGAAGTAEGGLPSSRQPGPLGWETKSVFNEARSTHLWIVNRAATLLKTYSATGQQIYQLVQPNLDKNKDGFHDFLCQGLYDADDIEPYNGPTLALQPTYSWHFYDPDTGKNWLDGTLTAYTQGALFFNQAVFDYCRYLGSGRQDPILYGQAGYHLGLALHYLTDLTQPMHAANYTYLSSWRVGYHSHFEAYIMQIQGATTPTTITRTVEGTDPLAYLHAAARATKDTYYQAVLAPINRFPKGYYPGYLSRWTQKELKALAPPMLRDATNWTAQFLLAWMEAVQAQCPST